MIKGGPKIETSGLQLYYDVNNIKSYPGEPTTNLLPTNYSMAGAHGITVTFIEMDNGWEKYSISGTWAADDTYPYSMIVRPATVSFTGGVAYTTKITLKTNVLDKFVYFGTAINYVNQPMDNNGTTVTSTNADGSVNVERKNFIYTSTTSQNGYLATRGLTAGTTFNASTDFVWCKHAQIEQKAHPTQYLTPGTARPDAAGLKDLSGNGQHATLANMTFDSNAEIDWDGVDDTTIQSAGSSVLTEAECTVDIWFKSNVTTSSQRMVRAVGSSTNRYYFILSPSANFSVVRGENSSRVVSTAYGTTDYHNAVVYWNSTGYVLKIWMDGVLEYSGTYSGVAGGGNEYLRLGTTVESEQNYNGKMPVVKVYNRALSDAERLQNYNAVKSRFGR